MTTNGAKTKFEDGALCQGIRANEIVPYPKISFNFSATDVKQGGLGNCYFISSLASLAHLPEVLRQRIPKHKEYSGESKTYEVNLFESGKSMNIIVDNEFPKIFAKPVGNDISLMVL